MEPSTKPKKVRQKRIVKFVREEEIQNIFTNMKIYYG